MIGSVPNRVRGAMLFPAALVLCGCISASNPGSSPSRSGQCLGIWSARSTPSSGGLANSPIPAPNGGLAIKVTKDRLFVMDPNGGEVPLDVEGNPALVEVLWSPDSRRIALNTSDGGVIGTWGVEIYDLSVPTMPVAISIVPDLKRQADLLPLCDEQEEANVGAVGWLNDGKELLLVAEAPPHSSCRNMGAIAGFRVSMVTGEVLARFSEEFVRSEWREELGCRIANKP